jgi:formate C-acetyltransferase
LKEVVYEKREVPIGDMLKALECNFNGYEVIHQKCLNARKFGNNDYYADNIARELDDFFRSISHKYNTLYGGKLDLRYVPVTAHVPLGRIVAATPNGRKSMEPLSEGISPTQGADIMGPTSTFLSIAKSKNSVYKEGAARLFNIKLSPQAVAGSEGTKRLVSLIRSWCDLKIWHLQFNIINARTLCAALVTPEKYRNLMVRVAGYSAYFVDLSTELKKEIIMRTEHKNI